MQQLMYSSSKHFWEITLIDVLPDDGQARNR